MLTARSHYYLYNSIQKRVTVIQYRIATHSHPLSRQYAIIRNCRGIFSVAKNFSEATAPKRQMLEVEDIVAEKNYTLEFGTDQQKILRYWTKYAIYCASFIV